jgi:hypothetical protein
MMKAKQRIGCNLMAAAWLLGLTGMADGDLSAQAVTEAEAEANGGVPRLIRWRVGNTENVQWKLPVLGTYAPTAPDACAKSKRISVAERQSNFPSVQFSNVQHRFSRNLENPGT